VDQFKRGDFSTCDAPRPGRHKTATTPKIIDKIHKLILEDGRISAKSIAEQLGISRERVGSIIHEDLDMWKLSAKWVPKCLNADQNVNGASRLSNFWNIFCAIQKISFRDWWPWTKPGYITMTRRQRNNQRSGSIAAHHAPKIPSAKILWKIFASIFWNQDNILPFDYLSKAQTIIAEYYSFLLVQLKDTLKKKVRGKVTKGYLILHDNAPAHRALATQKKLAHLGFQCLVRPPYSPDLAPSDYHMFLGLKNQLKSRHFSSDSDVVAAQEIWLDGHSDFFF